MRTDMIVWAALALLLFAAEALAPGAFMLWMGFAAAAVFVLVWAVPALPVLVQAVAFVVLSFVSIQIYRRWFRRGRGSDRPLLNRRAEQLVGRSVVLARPIVEGQGQVRLDDTLWQATGPDLPAGAIVRVAAVEGTTLRVVADTQV
ncbi:NfeD family protein [Xanthomonas massiliensis]|uniref:NfeD family protein n=1 Tax=Xanthomonas massiliensis TaxID=1720302 RepID=UPI000826D50A|nr:NfeD family protein [Xanthomonas massiliensis]